MLLSAVWATLLLTLLAWVIPPLWVTLPPASRNCRPVRAHRIATRSRRHSRPQLPPSFATAAAVDAQVPDVAVVLLYGAVRREEPGLCDVHQGLALPAMLVSHVIQDAGLLGQVGVEVREGHEPVLAQELLRQTLEAFRIAHLKHLRSAQEVDGLLEALVPLVVAARVVVATLVARDDLVGALAKGVDVPLAHEPSCPASGPR